ncbi:MAG: hypothetical protein J1E98_00945 [Lachnospiraceae bacterium]|nr:hypothetical protein [Lachnospiraceae bacterium]
MENKDKLLKNKLKFNRPDKYQVLIISIMLLSAILLIYLTGIKEGMHLDEYLTYGLANSESENNNKITPEYGVRLAATDVFDTFFYPDGFSVSNVWENQANNVHPPLYYLIFHIFTLVTHHFLALKTGILLNIFFHVINIALVRLIIKELLHNECYALFGALLYAFTPVILGNVLFIRMYMLMSTYVLGLTLLFIRGLNKSDKKSFYIKLGLISVFGTLTHYYFLIYLFYCCVIWGINILIKRRWKELVVFVGTMTVAGIACVAVFPAILKQLFTGAAGERTIKNLFSSAFLGNIGKFSNAIDNVYGGFLPAIIITFILLLVFRYVIWKGSEKKSENIAKWMILIIPCILYFLTITWLAIMAAARYISPIYPICIILLMGLFDSLASYMTTNDKAKCIAGLILISILLNSSWKTYTWTELYLEAEDCVKTARKYGVNNECIYVLNVSWHSFPTYQEFIQYQNMTFIRDNNLDLLFNENYTGYDHVVMYFDTYVDDEEVDRILTEMVNANPGLNGYEKLHEYMYNTAYYLD